MKSRKRKTIIGIIIVLVIVLFFQFRKTEAEETIYDVALFWGQSNMVGYCPSDISKAETLPEDPRLNSETAKFRSFLSESDRSLGLKESYPKVSGISLDILENYDKRNHVNVELISKEDGYSKNTVFDFSYLTYKYGEGSPMKPITKSTLYVGEGLTWAYYDTTQNKYISCANEAVIAGGYCNNASNRKLLEAVSSSPGENQVLTANYPSVEKSHGTNMIPEFGRTHYEKTGHKLVTIMAANGGEPLANFLPHDKITEYYNNPDMEVKRANQFIYESMVEEYKGAIAYLESKGYKIGNKFYVMNQGKDVRTIKENIELVTAGNLEAVRVTDPKNNNQPFDENTYKRIYEKIHSSLMNDLDLDFGVIADSSITSGSAKGYLDTGALKKIHDVKKGLAASHSDIIMGSEFVYENFIPGPEDVPNDDDSNIDVYNEDDDEHSISTEQYSIAADEYSRNADKISNKYKVKTGNNQYELIPYEAAREFAYLSLCVRDDNKSNAAHLNAAAYSQVGRETANKVAEYLNDYPIYKVSFYANGGTGTMDKISVYSNTPFQLTNNAFSKEGYTFVKWNTKVDGTGTSYENKANISSISEDLDLYAQWKGISYSVKFNANGGNGTMANQSHQYGSQKSLTANAFTRSGYKFVKWNTKADGTGTDYTDKQNVLNLTTTSGEVVELFAQWEIKNYTISYELNGGTLNNPKESYTVNDPEYTLGTPVKTGYTFIGWTGSNGSTPQKTVKIPAGSTGNKSYTANYSINSYTVTFEPRGGTTPNPSTIRKEYNKPIGNLPTSTKTGYTLDGWYTAASGGTKITTETLVTKNITYYAVWNPIHFVVKYNSNGGNGTIENQSFTYGQSQNLRENTFSKEGSVFNSWNTKADGTGKTYANKQSIKNLSTTDGAEITLYAQWSQGVYSITYDLNGGTLSKSNPSAYSSTTETFTLNNPTKEGHTFTGWTGSNGTTPQLSVSVVKGTTGNLEYTANYQINKYTVTFQTSDGQQVEREYEYGEEIVVQPPSEKTGYTFTGWYDQEGNLLTSGTTTPGENIVYQPRYSAHHYTIVFIPNNEESQITTQEFVYDQAKKLQSNPYTKSGYKFDYWSDQENGQGNKYQDVQEIVNLSSEEGASIVLYANWKKTDTVPPTPTTPPPEPQPTNPPGGQMIIPIEDTSLNSNIPLKILGMIATTSGMVMIYQTRRKMIHKTKDC